MKGPDKNSIRSKKRANRKSVKAGDGGDKPKPFVSLEVSSRKHRRMNSRRDIACTILRITRKPGDKVAVPIPGKAEPATHTAGGSVRFH